MRAGRRLAVVGASVVAAAVVAFAVPAIRERLTPRLIRAVGVVHTRLCTTRGTWTDGRPAPTTKMEAASAAVGSKLYVFGGYAGTSATSLSPVEPRVSVYDPATDAWSRAADMPIDVTHCNAVVVDGAVWFAGGYRGPHPGHPVANVLRYDAAADAWSEGPPLPQPMAAGTLALVGRTLHYVGGFVDRDTAVDRHWALALDGGTTWEPRAPLPVARGHLASAVVGDRLYAIGGQIRHDTNPVDLDVVHVYDSVRDAWTAVASLPTPRSHAEASTFVDHGRIVLVGGRDNTRWTPLDRLGLPNVTVYDPATDAWSERPALPLGLQAADARVIDGRLVVTNGAPMEGTAGQARTFVAAFP